MKSQRPKVIVKSVVINSEICNFFSLHDDITLKNVDYRKVLILHKTNA